MYLLVNKAGKYFRLDYRFAGKRKALALGVYPDMKLAEARQKRDDARKMIANDIDPGQARKAQKSIQIQQHENSFEAIAREWHGKYSANWPLLNETASWQRLIMPSIKSNAKK
jgi:hypothetical protein